MTDAVKRARESIDAWLVLAIPLLQPEPAARKQLGECKFALTVAVSLLRELCEEVERLEQRNHELACGVVDLQKRAVTAEVQRDLAIGDRDAKE